MQNVAFVLSNDEYHAIKNGGEVVAKALAEKQGFLNPTNMKIIDCGSFYRLFVEYERMEAKS